MRRDTGASAAGVLRDRLPLPIKIVSEEDELWSSLCDGKQGSPRGPCNACLWCVVVTLNLMHAPHRKVVSGPACTSFASEREALMVLTEDCILFLSGSPRRFRLRDWSAVLARKSASSTGEDVKKVQELRWIRLAPA